MKFVINDCFGGYGFSIDFLLKYGKEIGSLKRNDPKLVAAVEEFGLRKASGTYSALCIKEIPDDATDYYIDEYDGAETLIYVRDGKLHWA